MATSLGHIISIAHSSAAGAPRNLDRRIARVLEIFDEQLSQEQPPDQTRMLDSAARAVNLSVSRLRHLFKKQLGISPTRRLKEDRLVKARELLGGTFLSVKEVAARVGATDMSHFIRDYKQRYKETPSETKATGTAHPQSKTPILIDSWKLEDDNHWRSDTERSCVV